MTFLPIVQRELRLASRRKGTYRIRWATALIAMLGSLIAFLFIGLAGGLAGIGVELFAMLSGYAFALCILGGTLLTSDCLSVERREGTLGLLFLTDLKGYDVVLGKFVAVSLNAFYGLLALLPVLALPLLLGGLTGAEFWRMVLALVTTLFFSLSAGICVSAFVRNAERSMGGGAVLVLLAGGLLPLFAEAVTAPGVPSGCFSITWCSPAYAWLWAREPFYAAYAGRFWEALLISALMGCGFLALASWRLPRLAHEQGSSAARAWTWAWLFGRNSRSPATAAHRRARLLQINPIFWLISEGHGLRGMVWGVVGIWAIAVTRATAQGYPSFNGLFWPAKICGFLLKMLVAFQACRFFVEARRSGALELLFSAPLRNHEVLHGQWLAMKRLVLGPMVVAVLLAFAPFCCQLANDLGGIGAADPKATQAALAVVHLAGAVLLIGWFTLGMVVDIYAVTWVGMWLALSSKRPGTAAARTILFVLVLPSVIACGPDMLVDLFLILWSSSQLHQDFRWMHAQYYRMPPRSLPPPLKLEFPGRL